LYYKEIKSASDICDKKDYKIPMHKFTPINDIYDEKAHGLKSLSHRFDSNITLETYK
jgi:hypothetical protein